MWPTLALWAATAVVVRTCEAALSHRSLRQKQEPVSMNVDAAARARSEVAKFGPKNCIATWRNEDGHCEVETRCKDQDISKYAVKFICVDAGGEKVRHVFAAGSFDPEEQFDTLIECNKCLAEKQETIEIIADTPPEQGAKGAKKKAKSSKKKEDDSDQLGGAPLAELRDEVKELEVFMMNTSAELQKLNAKVYSKDFEPKVTLPSVKKVGKKAGENAKTVKSLVHHSTEHHRQEVEPLHLEVQAARAVKDHRRHLEEDDDEKPRKALKIMAKNAAATSSLAGALKGAEERDDEVPARQPEVAPMALSTADAQKKPKALVMRLPKAEDDDGEDDGDADEDVSSESSVPQSADDFESQEGEEDGDDERPDISALQQNTDDDDDSESEDDAEGEDASE